MTLRAATGSVDDAYAGDALADRSAAAQQGRRQRVLLFGSAFLVFAAGAVMLGAGRRPYPDGFISAAAFPFGIWVLVAALVLLAAAWLAAFRLKAPDSAAGLRAVLLGAGIAALTLPLFSLPWVLLSADAGLVPTPADTVVKWLWTAGIVLTGAVLVLSALARRRVRNGTSKRRPLQRR
ncbi:hypothetical protein [Brevibacterium luteolum]|uniref:hypothetical protein n=1 Tax=Brevibacterium luteolum TaxID=199591 RepID=UPI001C2172A2|nr:hypothetical protein [Brevibacterium luteolum]MBU8579265.1 hypothetical protein [Brevibacterium luteolum]